MPLVSEASNLLHIKTEQDYQDALEIMEHLFSTAKDTTDDPLNDLIEIISRTIEKYEVTQEDIIAFETKANNSLLSSCNNQLIQCLVDL